MDDALWKDLGQRRRAVARDVCRRLVAHVAAGGTTDNASVALEVDRSAYVDPARAERERRELFLGLPLVAGLSQDIQAPGDCLLFEDVGPSVFIVRGKDRRLRGFLNMCTHRATKLVRAGSEARCAGRDRFTCPFHAWTFDLEGKLVAVPGREGFDGIDLTKRNLVPVPVAECNGLVFVQATAGGVALDAPAHLGAFVREIEQLELGNLAPVRSSVVTANANWKSVIDTYCEGYHFGTLHRSTIGRSHHSNVAVFEDFAPHWRINFAERSLDALVGQPEGDWPEVECCGTHFLFPNTIIVAGTLGHGEPCVRTFRLFPGVNAGTMSCRIAVYAPQAVLREPNRVEREFACDDAESEITKEDFLVAVEGYRNLENAPEGFKVIFGRNEPALQALHRAVARSIGEGI